MTMRHFFWTMKDGTIGGTCAQVGGYGPEVDPTDEATTDPVAMHLRETYASRPDFGGFVAYDCGCDPKKRPNCPCMHRRVDDSYVRDGVLTRKPVATFYIDGVELKGTGSAANTPYLAHPLSKFVLSVRAPGLDEDVVIRRGNGVAITLEEALRIKDGESEPLEITAPMQGMVGALTIGGPRLKVARLFVMGWAS